MMKNNAIITSAVVASRYRMYKYRPSRSEPTKYQEQNGRTSYLQ